MKPIALLAAALLAWSAVATAQVPQLVSYQGRVAVGTVNFDGSGQFKFALVNADGSTTYWSNDGTSTAGSQPANAVALTVTKGLYSVLLGDTSLANMTPIPTSVWANADVRLRVWFNDGTLGSQLLTPDQRLAPSGYLPDGGVTSAKLANGAVGGAQIGNGAVGSAQLAAGAVTSAKLATGALASGQTASGNTQAVANTHYVATGTGVADHFDLPATANVGDTIQITGSGTGGWAANGTTSWTARESNRSWRSVASSADGSKLVAVVYGGQIYTSTDSGLSWTARESNRFWYSVATSADGSRLVAVASGSRIYTSTDSGVNWTARESNRNWNSVASSSDGSKLVAVVNGGGGQIYTSTDSGVSWTARESNRNWNSVASSSDGSKLVAVVYGGQIYTSTDSGLSWTARESPRNWNSVASSSDGSKLVAVTYGSRIYTSTDSGVHWTARESPRNWNSVASSSDGSRLVAVASAGSRIYASTDSGVNWTARESNRFWFSVASSADGSKLVAVVYGGQIYTNSLFGEPGSSVTLRYDGNGQWIPQQETQIATGAVGSSQIANGAVGATHIAAGAVTDDKLATPKVNRAGDTMTGLLTLPANGLNVGGNQLVAANDNVGIGANPPTARLDVVGGIKASGAEGFTFNSGDQDGGLFSPADGTLTFKTDGSERLRLAANGNVGINRIPTTNRLEVEGNASKSTAGDWLANSDRRIKEDILPVTGALDTLAKVRLVDFRYTEDYRATHPGVEDKRYLNVVAQEFAEVFPDHVQRSGEKLPDGSDILQVDTYPLTIYSAAAVQELKREKDAEVKALREENAGLRKESADLKERLDRLEKALLEGAAAR